MHYTCHRKNVATASTAELLNNSPTAEQVYKLVRLTLQVEHAQCFLAAGSACA
jgi:hypothetical protein